MTAPFIAAQVTPVRLRAAMGESAGRIDGSSGLDTVSGVSVL
jgi:hypothetical protein